MIIFDQEALQSLQMDTSIMEVSALWTADETIEKDTIDILRAPVISTYSVYEKIRKPDEIIRCIFLTKKHCGALESLFSGAAEHSSSDDYYKARYLMLGTNQRILRFSLDRYNIYNGRIRSIPYDSISKFEINEKPYDIKYTLLAPPYPEDSYILFEPKMIFQLRRLHSISATIRPSASPNTLADSSDLCPRCFGRVTETSASCGQCDLRFIDSENLLGILELLIPGWFFFKLGRPFSACIEIFMNLWPIGAVIMILMEGVSGNKLVLYFLAGLFFFFIKLFYYMIVMEIVSAEKFVHPRQIR